MQLLSDNTANDLFERLLLTSHIGSEGIVEHRLVVTSPLFFHLGTEPVNYISIKSNGDPNFLP